MTGKIDEKTTFAEGDFRNVVPRFSPEARKANQALVDRIASIAAAKQATQALAEVEVQGLVIRHTWPRASASELHGGLLRSSNGCSPGTPFG